MYYSSYKNVSYGKYSYRSFLLYHEGKATITASAGISCNAKRINIRKTSADIRTTVNLTVNTELRKVVTASVSISVSSGVSVNSILRHYSRTNINSIANINIKGFVFALASAEIKANGGIYVDGAIRKFEQAKIACSTDVITRAATRWFDGAKITCGVDVGVGSIVVIHVNAIINISVEMKAKATEIIHTGIADKDTYSFSLGGKCYFYNGDDFYYYDGDVAGKVVDIAYVPTFTMGRSPTGGGVQFEGLNYLSNSWKDSFSTTDSDIAYQLSFDDLSSDTVLAWLNGEEKAEGDDFTVDRSTGIVTFAQELGEGTDNLIIQASKNNLMDSDFITKATKFIIYGGKNDNRVFACRGNTRYHCGLNDPTYWPENNYAAITSDAENLVGFGKMYDYLINLKENSLTFTTLDSDVGGDVIFPIYPLNDEYGCLAPDSIQPVANGLIFLAQTKTGAPAGVAYLSPTTVRNQLNVRIISEDINKSVHVGVTGLTEYSKGELIRSKSYIYDNKYWLRVGDRTWVLDLRESDFGAGKYCWYPYSGPVASANCFVEHDGQFYVGNDTGTIYCENKGFNDGKEVINAYWTSPIIYCGSRSWTKDFEELHIIFGPQVQANHLLTFVTDEDREIIDLEIESARLFDYGDWSYGAFHYGTNPYPSKQTELVGYSAEYLQWIIENRELNQGLTILAQELDYLWGERS